MTLQLWLTVTNDHSLVAKIKRVVMERGLYLKHVQASSFLSSVISCARQTTADHFQYVRLDKLDISNTEMECKPGDVILLQPSNLSHKVE